ncbi:uncharacterized protein CDAR_61791 [Caerostris darwini]|uniref:Uncharacterized protein n=1 Tax=Caerostris darwini TaxID=1538125 RepID=A0AAV4VJM4_9ARAC|nr:uncharacterized protein CDAR_61791 [Caerostris darwini]
MPTPVPWPAALDCAVEDSWREQPDRGSPTDSQLGLNQVSLLARGVRYRILLGKMKLWFSISLALTALSIGYCLLDEDYESKEKDGSKRTAKSLDVPFIPQGGKKADWTVQPVKIIIRDKPGIVNVPHPYPVKHFVPVPKVIPYLKKVPILKPLPVPLFVPKIKVIPKKILVPKPFKIVKKIPIPKPYFYKKEIPIPKPLAIPKPFPVPIPKFYKKKVFVPVPKKVFVPKIKTYPVPVPKFVKQPIHIITRLTPKKFCSQNCACANNS